MSEVVVRVLAYSNFSFIEHPSERRRLCRHPGRVCGEDREAKAHGQKLTVVPRTKPEPVADLMAAL